MRAEPGSCIEPDKESPILLSTEADAPVGWSVRATTLDLGRSESTCFIADVAKPLERYWGAISYPICTRPWSSGSLRNPPLPITALSDLLAKRKNGQSLLAGLRKISGKSGHPAGTVTPSISGSRSAKIASRCLFVISISRISTCAA